MLSQKQLADFAELSVKVGVNLQKGQELVIRSPIECAEIARYLAEAGYKAGAKLVIIDYNDEKMARISYDYASAETLEEVPQYVIEKQKYVIDHRCAVISIAARNPNNLLGVDPEKIRRAVKASSLALKEFQEKMMANYVRWLVISVPTKAWADMVFPNCENSVDKLWDAIAATMRLNDANPLQSWEKHIEKLTGRAEFLNKHNFDYLHLTSASGTDIKVGLADKHVWQAAQEMAQDGIPFTANLPTEEVFTAPHNKKINGTVHSALPLVNNGNIIDNFWLTYKDGVVVDFGAEKGYDSLKRILDTDDGAKSLGEIALIGKNSPIAQSKLLFLNTLFDENASCHFAMGRAYPSNIENGAELTPEQLAALGHNNSLVHVDFMVGTPDINIVGVDKKGNKVQLFVDGEWVI